MHPCLRDIVVELFDSLRETGFKGKKGRTKQVGPTATSKILHLICPDLFVMWDSDIRRQYRKFEGDGKEYFEFLLTIQTLMLRLEPTITALREKNQKKPTRIIDQFNWMNAHDTNSSVQ